MRKILFLVGVFLCTLATSTVAQKTSNDYPVFDKVEKAIAKSSLSQFTLVSKSNSDLLSQDIPKTELEDGILLDLDMAAISNLRTLKPEALQLTFPLPSGKNVELSMVKNKVLTPDFILRQSSDSEQTMDYTPGLYYAGVISNDPNSLVSISVFEDEIIGLIHSDEGNFVIGKLKNTNSLQHIIYNDNDLPNPAGLDCGTENDGYVYRDEELTFDMNRAVGDCVRVYIEIDDDIVTQKGGATNATNYITGLMNEVITLYANDNLAMAISEIFAWSTPAPYSGSSSSAMLSSYQSNTGSFNGDLSHLMSYQASGGIAAGFSGLCNSNVDNSKCFSSIDASYNNVPSYSFSVMVVTHEMGHLIGSRHTHACVWNGNGTAIDGCAGGTEGSCSLPGSPSGGGTIMSYCHLTTGINFNLGFGSQPQAVILNSVANANCLSSCSGPTCSDNIQNGDETGVDCGGTSCPPCSSGCNDNEINVSITFDNYPEETSWTLKNAGGTTVASGGTYGSQPDGSSITIPLCEVDGCYDFTINDTYGDGICCGYGNGSYSVTDGSGTVLASGGSFTTSETTNFCFNGGPIFGCTDPNAHNYDSNATADDGSCETCSDGVQNGDETGTDCGGALCSPCGGGGSTVIFGHYFESGWDGWQDGGSDCYRYNGSRSWEGTRSIRLRDNSGVASSMTSSTYNMSSYSSAEIEFYFYPNSMETGEDFWVQVNTGSGWTTVASYASGTSFNNGSFYVATVPITSLGSNTQFRFRCDASANADQVYIDAVTLTGFGGSSLVGEPTIAKVDAPIRTLPEASLAQEVIEEKGVHVYPNPAGNFLNVETTDQMQLIKVYGANGNLVKSFNATAERNEEIDISDLISGFYYISIETNEGTVNAKFVKM